MLPSRRNDCVDPYAELLRGYAEGYESSTARLIYEGPANGTKLFNHPYHLGASWYLLAVPLCLYCVNLVIEFIIPADQHAVRAPSPPAPPPPAQLDRLGTQSCSDSSATELDTAANQKGGATSAHLSKKNHRSMHGIDIASAYLEHGLLRVHLIGAKGLKPADRNGKSDPYVRLLIAGQRAKSKTIKATLNPNWDETFEFEGVRGELLKHDLQLRVFDWDLASTDDKLGDASLSLEPVLHRLEHSCEVELSTQGQVSLRLSWAPQGQPMPAAAGSAPAKLGRSKVSAIPGGASRTLSALDDPAKKGMGKMRVRLLRGEGLMAADKDGKSDPFVKLALGGQAFTSKIIKKTLNPRWNEVFEFEGVRAELASKPLELKVYDWDPVTGLRAAQFNASRHDALGAATLDLTPMASSGWKVYTAELTGTKELEAGLKHNQRSDLGRLHLMVTWEASGQADMGALQDWIAAAWDRFLAAAAKFIVGNYGPDPMAIPALYAGKAWAARPYYMTTWAGPREGECSEHPVSLGWLHQMAEEGHLPRDIKVWCVEGGTAWVTLGSEMNKVKQAEKKAAKGSASDEAGAAAQTVHSTFYRRA